MLEQFRQYEIKNTRAIFGKQQPSQSIVYGDEPDLENQFTLDCPGAPRPIHYTAGMNHCLPILDHTDPTASN